MGDKKRRTEIQIETHEITIIRFGRTQKTDSVDKLLEGADVFAHADIDPEDTTATEEKEKENEK